jgi:hypothetical protein
MLLKLMVQIGIKVWVLVAIIFLYVQDWLSNDDFANFSKHNFDDFINALPMQQYCHLFLHCRGDSRFRMRWLDSKKIEKVKSSVLCGKFIKPKIQIQFENSWLRWGKLWVLHLKNSCTNILEFLAKPYFSFGGTLCTSLLERLIR